MGSRNWIAPVALGLVLLAGWFLLTATELVGAWALPAPQAVFTRIVSGVEEGYLLSATARTLYEAILGCALAAVIGIPLGFGIAHWRPLAASIQPYLAASQAIPAVALAPLLVLWVGYGTTSIVVLCTIMVMFPIVISTAVGVRSIDPEVIGAARLDGAGSFTLLYHIEVPLASPNLISGLRNGFTLSITGAVVGEMVIGGNDGLGIVLVGAQHLNDVTGMFAAIGILAVLAIAIYVALLAFENTVVAAVS